MRQRNTALGGFPDVAFDSAFTELTGIGVPEALDQAEQGGRLATEDYDDLREALGLGTGGPFTQTHPTGTSARDREVTLRMLDRVARLVKEALRKENREADAQVTPHIAVALLPDGSLGVAGNTGAKALTSDEAALVEQELRWFVTGQEAAGTPRQRKLEQWNRDEEQHRQSQARLNRRQQELDQRAQELADLGARLDEQYESGAWNDERQQQWDNLPNEEEALRQDRQRLTADQQQWRRDERWLARRRPAMAREMRDRTKLRALATGWYRLYHPGSPELDLVKRALANPTVFNVSGRDATPAFGSYGSEHGELTLLGHWVEHWQNNPGDPNNPQMLDLGGFKMACASCDLAYQAVNEHIGRPLGHRVQASGTHGTFFPGWRMPQWMQQRTELSEPHPGQRGKHRRDPRRERRTQRRQDRRGGPAEPRRVLLRVRVRRRGNGHGRRDGHGRRPGQRGAEPGSGGPAAAPEPVRRTTEGDHPHPTGLAGQPPPFRGAVGLRHPSVLVPGGAGHRPHGTAGDPGAGGSDRPRPRPTRRRCT
ncbi:hypothetical protein WKI71_39975 [Streptomyces sp. MS1.AVA.1]|uniref:Tox-PL domain-containing protein n=1 Tax=Streptomyces machairae TaxID=3134109 RepID=A0ABU8UTT2_9ACTN